ncbi:phage holin family protein [Patescibacteria group bacterium]|nr:phage holin family protein [Patescibacteria group bacterium]
MVDIIAFFGTWQMRVIVTLITVDVVLGIIAALIKKEFVFGKLANFMKGPVLAYVFGFVIVEIIGKVLDPLDFVVPAAFVLIVIVLLASIFKNLSRLGIPVPDGFRK